MPPHEVKTKSVYHDEIDKRKDIGDGYRVLIIRYWPRPLTTKQVAAKRKFLDLAPSPQLHKDWRNRKDNGMTWTNYTERFLNEIANNPQAELCIEFLRNKLKTSDITLLCNEESDNPYCHRYIVKALIEGKIYMPPYSENNVNPSYA